MTKTMDFDISHIETNKRLPDSIESYIKDHIISGDLAPNTIINETVLADALDISASTIRGSLISLARDKYLIKQKGEGYQVPLLNDTYPNHLYEVIYIINEAAFMNMNYCPNTLAILNQSLVCNGLTPIKQDRKFHVSICMASRNSEFLRIAKDSYDKIEWWFNTHENNYQLFNDEYSTEHRQILDSFIEHKGFNPALKGLLKMHFSSHMIDSELRL